MIQASAPSQKADSERYVFISDYFPTVPQSAARHVNVDNQSSFPTARSCRSQTQFTFPRADTFLERNNSSGSTLTTYTDSDETTYASSLSSGTTTPEDEDQTFYLGHMLPNVLEDKPTTSKSNRGGGITIGTKPRSLSLTMRRVKKAAQLLILFKKKVTVLLSATRMTLIVLAETGGYVSNFDLQSVERTIREKHVDKDSP